MAAQPFPREDIKKFFDAMMKQLKAGNCDSAGDAANKAFVSLKQQGVWNYAGKTPPLFTAQFDTEQKAAVAAFFAPVPKGTVLDGYSHFQTDRFARDSELGSQFLTVACTTLSRPHLAAEFNVPLELVSTALEAAVCGQIFKDKNKRLPRDLEYSDRAILHAAQMKPGWSNLTRFQKRSSYDSAGEFAGVHMAAKDGNWPFSVTREERDILTALENDKHRAEEKSLPPKEIPLPGSLAGGGQQEIAPHRRGKGGHSNRIRAEQVDGRSSFKG